MSLPPGSPGSTLPTASSSTTPFVAATKKSALPTKPINIFSNDGSFLERFRKDEMGPGDEKLKRQEAATRAKALEDRFKRRGKRTSEPATTTEDAVAGGGSSKKKLKKSEVELSEYEKEVHKLTKGCLREERISGMRPLTK